MSKIERWDHASGWRAAELRERDDWRFMLDASVALAALARTLKAACGSGGTAKDGAIEIQGDHRDTVVARLEQTGWRVKRAGG